MGILIRVLRPAKEADEIEYASSAPSDKHAMIVVSNVQGPFQPNGRYPAYTLIAHDRYPDFPPETGIGMASGNYGVSDATLADAVAKLIGHPCALPIPIMDRFE